MDLKTLLILWAILTAANTVVGSILKISGCTKTVVVEGGDATRIVGIVSSAASALG